MEQAVGPSDKEMVEYEYIDLQYYECMIRFLCEVAARLFFKKGEGRV